MAFFKNMFVGKSSKVQDEPDCKEREPGTPGFSHIDQMKDEYGDGGDDGGVDRDLSIWMKHFGLQKYAEKLVEAGLDSFNDLADIEAQDIEDIIEATGLPKFKANKVRKAIRAVQSGQYSPEEEQKEPAIPPRQMFQDGFHHIQCEHVLYDKRAMQRQIKKVVSTGNNKIVMVVGQTGMSTGNNKINVSVYVPSESGCVCQYS